MKPTCTVFLLCLIAFSSRAQAPVNDDCAGLIDLGVLPYCSDPGQYTNVDATTSLIDAVNNMPSCFNGAEPERDVWFQFTPPLDGSIIDVLITVFGDVGGNGTMHMPQVAIYRGDCEFGGLDELNCNVAPINTNQVELIVLGLTPGVPYFLRINDYSATAASNAGTFRLCVEAFVPDYNIGEVPGSQSCSGTLWDSGGPTGDYQPGENHTFTICPQDFHQCIVINVESYDLEQGWDFLRFFQGDDLSGVQITQLTGFGENLEVQIPGGCATIQFTSDGSGQSEGFQITWDCTADTCTAPPPTTCADPAVVGLLPFQADDLSNCFSGNSINDGPCDDFFLSGNDYVFAYTSPGDECIQIATTGTQAGAGIGVYDACPSDGGASCITSAGGGFNSANPVVNAAFLENPGTYYIVFGAGVNCSPFNITIDTVTCPVVLPPAATCDAALNIGGCSDVLPEIIALTPGAGDPDFIQQGLNQGCFVGPQENYSFFYFTAGADGKFGFTVQSADPAEASDIDFNVWGPIDNVVDICDFVTNNQPVRSSWAAGADPTGLADIHPVTNQPVIDEFDCGSPATPGAGGDDFVSMLDVVEGKIYVILLDDFGNAIVQGGISINFSNTTNGVLDAPDTQITVTADTAVCPGEPVQLLATGGIAYGWTPDVALTCSNCPNPVATPTESTSYQVQIASTCNTVVRVVDIKVIDIELGPDPTVCNGAEFTLNPNPFPNATYAWIGGTGLSCTDCPSPVVSGLPTGVYTYVGVLTTPQCVLTDTIKVTVLNGEQPEYNIAGDQVICAGETVSLAGTAVPGTFYNWFSDPAGFVSTDPNPTAAPTETTTFYLSASNGSCPVEALDSVVVTVFQPPVLQVQGDTAVCSGQSVLLATTLAETGVTYAWTPNDGSLSDPASPSPLATPTQTTTYVLTASNDGCTETRTVAVSVVQLTLDLNAADSVPLCLGASLPIQATVSPAGNTVTWNPLGGLQIGPGGQDVVATPSESTTYTATVSVPGCIRQQSVFIDVDSLPADLGILPVDTTICQGSQVTLTSAIYEPADFTDIEFSWTPGTGQLTPDSLYNLVVQPDTTTTYQRISRHGACVDTATAVVNVIIPPMFTVTPSDTIICPGQQVQLSATYTPGAEMVMWSPADGLSCTECDNPLATPASSMQYTISGTIMGCPGSATATITVRPQTLFDFPDDNHLCAGETVTLNAIEDPAATYSWTSDPPGFSSAFSMPAVAPTQTTTYFVTADNGCPAQGQVTIFVDSATLSASADTTICEGATAQLTASGSQPGFYQWSDNQSGQSVFVMPGETTIYTVVYRFGQDSSCVLTEEVTVEVEGMIAPVNPPADLELCLGESLQLNDVVTPGATYDWTSNPPGPALSGPDPSVTPNVTTTYTVTTTLGTCVYTREILVVVYDAVLTVPPDTTICAGETITLTASGTLTGPFEWMPGGSNPNGASTMVTPASTTSYHVTYSYGNGNCVLEDSVLVTVAPPFDLEIMVDPDTDSVIVGTPIDLTAIVVPTQSLADFDFTWTENNNPVGTGEMITVTPTTNAEFASFFYTVRAVSPEGCVRLVTDSVLVIKPKAQFPNVFTPNGDGTNDVFRLVIPEGSATVDRMEIYTRWGEKVFESSDPQAAWDGRIDGKEAPSEVYVYLVWWRTADGALQPLEQGDVTLLR